jgi:hypothetical protein
VILSMKDSPLDIHLCVIDGLTEIRFASSSFAVKPAILES